MTRNIRALALAAALAVAGTLPAAAADAPEPIDVIADTGTRIYTDADYCRLLVPDATAGQVEHCASRLAADFGTVADDMTAAIDLPESGYTFAMAFVDSILAQLGAAMGAAE